MKDAGNILYFMHGITSGKKTLSAVKFCCTSDRGLAHI
jgi:hypothetical protein